MTLFKSERGLSGCEEHKGYASRGSAKADVVKLCDRPEFQTSLMIRVLGSEGDKRASYLGKLFTLIQEVARQTRKEK